MVHFPRGPNDGPIDFHMMGLAKTPRKDQLDGFNLSSVKIVYKSMAKQYESHHQVETFKPSLEHITKLLVHDF